MPDPVPSHPPNVPVDLATERQALADARSAVDRKLTALADLTGGPGGADALAAEYIDAVLTANIEKLRQELVVFGRIDDDHAWRVGIYGIDSGGEQLVVDWRAPFAAKFYRARLDEPLGLTRRVSYVGCITDLFVEDFTTGEVAGSSPLLTELSRSRGSQMRAAVATLQSEQDELVRLDPDARLVLRGGPGTGKTVVGLHRAAWLVYTDSRVTAERILVVGPSERFLSFVATVLPSLGESRIVQTTFSRLLGAATGAGADERWLDVLDRFEDGIVRPAPLRAGYRTIPETVVRDLVDRLRSRPLPWRERRRVFVARLAEQYGVPPSAVGAAAREMWPPLTTAQAMARLRRRDVLEQLGAPDDLVDAWLALGRTPIDGPLLDEVRGRIEGVPAQYSHVIVDEAQDMSLLQLRAVMRRADGLSLVGDDAQRSNPAGIGLRRAADLLGVGLDEMTTAYRMSAEIAEWLNSHAAAHGIDAVELVGIRPTGTPVRALGAMWPDEIDRLVDELRARWDTVAVIGRDDVWTHKGVEYDAVVVDTDGMGPAETYLAASRAAHELVVVSGG